VIVGWDLEKDAILKVGERLSVFSRSTKNRKNLDSFIDFIDKRLAIAVTYCSLAGECETRCSSDDIPCPAQ